MGPGCKVNVKLYATLARRVAGAVLALYPQGIRAGQPLEVELPAGSTVNDLLATLGLSADQIMALFVNGRSQALDHGLEPGDQVAIFPPIGGG